MKKISVIEDDENIRDAVLYALRASGFEAMGYESADGFYDDIFKSGASDFTADEISLVILDVMLPGDDGFTVLRRLRNIHGTKNLPVIMLTAKGSEFDKVTGLDLGADDYITKPFGVIEMIARVNAVLRRTQPQVQTPSQNPRIIRETFEGIAPLRAAPAEIGSTAESQSMTEAQLQAQKNTETLLQEPTNASLPQAPPQALPLQTQPQVFPQADVFEYENLLLDNAKRIVTVDGSNIALTYKEYELLHYMMLNRGLALSRDKLIEEVWGYDFEGESRTLDMHIKTLRRKLGRAGGCIITIRNFGYKLGT